METWTFSPIGHLRSERRNRYDAPRQGVLDVSHVARIVLDAGRNFEQALEELGGFERIWILYVFHLNEGWRPRVHVPRHRRDKVGVFATRAPYRPNPIGLSCVRLLRVMGLELQIADCDLLDGTPVLDIKPYLPYADSFPGAAQGWIPLKEELYRVQCDRRAEEQFSWLKQHDVDIFPFAVTQLEAAPREGRRKRIKLLDAESDTFVLAYRTWRVRYHIDDVNRIVRITDISSGYTAPELALQDDPHRDKSLHTRFINFASFPCPD